MMNPVRILVTGSRHWHCRELAEDVIARLISRYGPHLVIVHGACPTGVDAAFAEAAEEHDLTVEAHAADWDKFGRAAGPKRNEHMVSLGADLCIAAHQNLKAGAGTQGCARLALAAGIPVWLIYDEAGSMRRLTMEDVT